MSKFYEVTFLTKKGGEKEWVIHIEAENAKEAKNKAKDMWNADKAKSGKHMFNVKVRVLKATEEFLYHYFKVCD